MFTSGQLKIQHAQRQIILEKSVFPWMLLQVLASPTYSVLRVPLVSASIV